MWVGDYFGLVRIDKGEVNEGEGDFDFDGQLKIQDLEVQVSC